MSKIFNITSKKEYSTPIIFVEELDKSDILTSSDNAKRNMLEMFSPGSNKDLFSSAWNDISDVVNSGQ